MNDKWLFRNLGKVLIFTVIIGFLLLIFIEFLMVPREWILSPNRESFITNSYLEQLANYSAPAGLIISMITIVLLYVNFRHQQLEFAKMNDLPLVLYEKKKLSEYLAKFEIQFKEKTTFSLTEISKRLLRQMSILNHELKHLDSEGIEIKNSEEIIHEGLFEEINNQPDTVLEELREFTSSIDQRLRILRASFSNPETVELLYFEFDPYFLRFIKETIKNFSYPMYNANLEKYFKKNNIEPKDQKFFVKYGQFLFFIKVSPLKKIILNIELKHLDQKQKKTFLSYFNKKPKHDPLRKG